MAYIVLARKWRPKTFEEVVGQKHITTTLKNAIKADRLAHAYLFSGPRGIGKTTTARLLAKSLNCLKGPTPTACNKCPSCQEISQGTSLDVLEIDGASNRGIDEIRNLRANVKFTPAAGKYKVYIIDEVHMLTTEAFNALLKTLEEPPLHVKFIFATTQASRVPSTILSRCQRFDFRLLTVQEIVEQLKKIIQAEKIKITDEALISIARSAEGSMRDAQSVLDQLISFTEKKITEEDVYILLGTVKEAVFEELTSAIARRDTAAGLKIINNLLNEGKDLRFFLSSCLEHFRNLVMLKLGEDSKQLVDLPFHTIQRLDLLSNQFSLEELLEIIYLLAEVEGASKGTHSIKFALEMAIISLTELPKVASFQDILKRLAELERKLAGENNDSLKVSEVPASSDFSAHSQAGHGVRSRGGSREKAEEVDRKEEGNEGGDQGATPNNKTGKILSLSQIEKFWPEIVQQVRKAKITAGAFLAEAKPSKLMDKVLTLDFKPSCKFHKESVEGGNNKRLIQEIIKEKLDEDLAIKCILSQGEVEAEDKNPKFQAKAKSHDPLIEKMLHLFKGEIIEGD